MGKYNVLWCRIWDFKEEVKAETEEEAYEKILEERKTQGSTIEILSVMRIDMEEVKQKGKGEMPEHVKFNLKMKELERKRKVEEKKPKVVRKAKEKK